MPEPDAGVIERRDGGSPAIAPREGIISDADRLRAYESDVVAVYRQVPLIVVPRQTQC